MSPGLLRWTLDTLKAHPVLSVFVVALSVRAVVATVIFLKFGGTLFNDDVTYSSMAAAVVEGRTETWNEFIRGLYVSVGVLTLPLTALFAVFGPIQLVGQLLVAVYGAAAAAAVTRLSLEVTERHWSLVAGGIVALLPAQVVFSSVVLKDAGVWAAAAGLAAVLAVANRSSGRRLLWLAAASVVLLFLLAHLRAHSLVVACWAMALTTLVGRREGRLTRVVGGAGIAIMLPWVLGLGPAGLTLVTSSQASLTTIRMGQAVGASTAIVAPPPDPRVPAERDSPPRPEGAVPVPVPEPGAPEEGLAADIRHLPRGLDYMLFQPHLWAPTNNPHVELARYEMFLWYPLLLLAAAGLLELRRHAAALAFPLLIVGATAVMYALAEGNFGTAYRHRGEMVWGVAVFAAVGARRIHVGWRTSRGG